MAIEHPKPEDVRVQNGVVTHVRTAQQAVVSRHGDFWRVTSGGAAAEYPACPDHHDICPWPCPECYSSARHIREQCHGWHAPRAVVVAAGLLVTAAARITAGPPPRGSYIARGDARPPRGQRFDPRGRR